LFIIAVLDAGHPVRDVALPAHYRVQPAWPLPTVLLALLVALIIGTRAASTSRRPGCGSSPAP
jgi:hypothetical protein